MSKSEDDGPKSGLDIAVGLFVEGLKISWYCIMTFMMFLFIILKRMK